MALCSFEVLRTNYPVTLCYIPEEQSPHAGNGYYVM